MRTRFSLFATDEKVGSMWILEWKKVIADSFVSDGLASLHPGIYEESHVTLFDVTFEVMALLVTELAAAQILRRPISG